MTTNKDIIIDELKDEIENLAYENKRMGDFIQLLGLAPDEITSYVIHGHVIHEHKTDVKRMIDYVIENNR